MAMGYDSAANSTNRYEGNGLGSSWSPLDIVAGAAASVITAPASVAASALPSAARTSVGNNGMTTVLRGMSQAEFDSLSETGVLTSNAMRNGVENSTGLSTQLWHTFTSADSPYVSTTYARPVAGYFASGSDGVVAQFQVPASALVKSMNVFKNEYLVLGGTQVQGVQVMTSAYSAGVGRTLQWGAESLGGTILVGGAGYGAGKVIEGGIQNVGGR